MPVQFITESRLVTRVVAASTLSWTSLRAAIGASVTFLQIFLEAPREILRKHLNVDGGQRLRASFTSK